MSRSSILLYAMIGTAICLSNSSASIITYSGKFNDAGPAGLLAMGSDGYDLYATSLDGEPTSSGGNPFGPVRLKALPSYVANIVTAGANAYYRSNSYQHIINPQTGTMVHAGLTYNFSPSNQEKGLLSIQFGQNPPPVLYVGYLTDTGDGDWDYPDSVRFKQIAGIGFGDSGLIATQQDANFGIDLYFFKIAGALPGDVITISGAETNCGVNWCNLTSAGLVFTQIPEPASLSLFSLLAAAIAVPRPRAQRRLHP